jgi:uncharacterized membrane protein
MQPEPPPGSSAHDGPVPGGPVPEGHAPEGHAPEGPAPRPPVPPEPAAGQGPPGRLRATRMPRPPRPGRARSPVWYALVTRAEHAEQVAVGDVHKAVPAWRRSTRGEPRWPVTISVIVAIVLQRLLPGQLALRPVPGYLVPTLEGGVLVALAIANPVRIERRGPFVRWVSIVLILVISIANAASAVLLIQHIVTGHAGTSPMPLLASGAAIWATNVIAFALWYWEFDRGGPVHRAHATFQYLDFLFPQMTIDHLVDPDWEPRFVDYLYLSFTNATAFSPTDVMPMARWAKLTMLVQSAVSLSLGALVIARAVNILPTG